MNTANLQLEGLYVAVSALMAALRQKNLLTEAEIEAALADAEEVVADDPKRPEQLTHAHVDAICFPIRYLRAANRRIADGDFADFSGIAAQVGREKPQQADILAQEREDIEESEDANVRRLEALDAQRGGRGARRDFLRSDEPRSMSPASRCIRGSAEPDDRREPPFDLPSAITP